MLKDTDKTDASEIQTALNRLIKRYDDQQRADREVFLQLVRTQLQMSVMLGTSQRRLAVMEQKLIAVTAAQGLGGLGRDSAEAQG